MPRLCRAIILPPMKRQTYSKEKIAGLEVTQVTNKTIVLPFKQATYSELLEDKQAYNAFIEKQIAAHPELLPSNIAKGWSFYGTTKSLDNVKLHNV